jgi:hypothetical protein
MTPFNPECESRQSETTHGQWRSRLLAPGSRTRAEHREPRTLASRFGTV